MTKRAVKDLGVLAAGFLATVVVALGAGLLLVPRLDTNGLPSSGRIHGTSAILVVDGDVQGRFILDRSDIGVIKEAEGGEVGPIDIEAAYSGSSASLSVTADAATVGVAISGDDLDVELVLNGEVFQGTANCSVIVEAIRYTILRPMPAVRVGPPRGVPLPAFSGRIECQNLDSLETGRRVDVSGVFRWEPDDGLI